jgi:hypothetical protein
MKKFEIPTEEVIRMTREELQIKLEENGFDWNTVTCLRDPSGFNDIFIQRSSSLEIIAMTSALESLYPIEANYGSKCSLYNDGLQDGIITTDEFDDARDYYGRLWHYTGD